MDFRSNKEKISKLNGCDVSRFSGDGSFPMFLSAVKVNSFRHIRDVELTFDHPVTIISGSNRVGKTSLLLLIAGSHERFVRLDATKPVPTFREHGWRDIVSFTRYEGSSSDYSYSLRWREGKKTNSADGKWSAKTRAWSGIAKKSSDKRKNAKIKSREVRLVDLDRLLPARSFSSSLLHKSIKSDLIELGEGIVRAFCFVLELQYTDCLKIYEVSSHINKRCYLIEGEVGTYSSYGAATGEEALINLLRDIFESSKNSLIMIDELEAGFHPAVQRRLINAIFQVSWEHKKQFIITSHSPSIMDEVPKISRKFIERNGSSYRVSSGVSPQAALSKMDTIGYPLVRVYCEDDLALFLISKVMIEISKEDKFFARRFEVIRSGPANQVANDYNRHKYYFEQLRNKIGYSAVLDGDQISRKAELNIEDDDDKVAFIFPFIAPEKFLAEAFLTANPDEVLSAYLSGHNHHGFFGKMVDLEMAATEVDARSMCYDAFKKSDHFEEHFRSLSMFLKGAHDFFEQE